MQLSGTPNPSERDLLISLEAILTERVPSAWRFTTEYAGQGSFWANPDAYLTVEAPDGRRARLGVEAKLSFYPRDVYTMSTQLGGVWPANPRPRGRQALQPGIAGWLVLSRFLTARTQSLLREAGFSYADATGNVLIDVSNPPIYLDLQGATTNPRPTERTVRTLKGSGSSQVVRALIDYSPPYTLRDLAQRAGLSLGTASRVIAYLVEEALVTRDGRGPIVAADWRGLIERWADDYKLLESNQPTFCLEPRGVTAIAQRLENLSAPYAVTGSLAAAKRAPVATPALAAIYVRDTKAALADLGLRPTSGSGNVVLLQPPSGLPFERTWTDDDGIVNAALSQVAVDLSTGPGRGPSEADALLDWMEANESAWRRS
jgi:hypothetical protein